MIISIVIDCIINLLFTLLQIVANDKIISHTVIMILIKADLMGGGGGGGGERVRERENALEIKHKKILSPDYNSYSLGET